MACVGCSGWWVNVVYEREAVGGTHREVDVGEVVDGGDGRARVRHAPEGPACQQLQAREEGQARGLRTGGAKKEEPGLS